MCHMSRRRKMQLSDGGGQRSNLQTQIRGGEIGKFGGGEGENKEASPREMSAEIGHGC